ncbi:hypothetical protein PS662_00530 [Pseudomonas fluorescens]|uniref:Fibronectin type-III domain-containing protein n=1 Tax=Pseudomonas fluorescens TaxID=294 RepID=A0A5E6PPR5_PSEFL|nr:fibronectin type III domain-containing protein [Pseudomonas fluorescens]VVM45591.1 hypothetical protein PS662_00530 [Pseudomonas fluorescens]
MVQERVLSQRNFPQRMVGVLITLFFSLLFSGCVEKAAEDPEAQKTGGVLSGGVAAYEPYNVADKYDIPFNKVTRVTAHNAYEDPMEKQLARGVRGFMLDLHYSAGPAYALPLRLCHVSAIDYCGPSSKSFVAEMNNIFMPFLKSHPNEIITIHLETKVRKQDLLSTFEQIPDLAKYVFDPAKIDTSKGWPTLRQMIENNQRIIFIADSDGVAGNYIVHENTDQQAKIFVIRDRSLETQNVYNLGDNALNHNWSCTTRWESHWSDHQPAVPCTTKGVPEGCPIAAVPCQVEGIPKGCPHLGVTCQVEGIPKGCPIEKIACVVNPQPAGCPIAEVPSRLVQGVDIDPAKAGNYTGNLSRLFVMNQFHAWMKSIGDAGNIDNNLTYLERRVDDHCKAAAAGVRIIPNEIAIDYTNIGDAQPYADALTHGGTYFYEKKNADTTGDTTCVLPAGQDYKLTLPSNGCENDEIQSLRLRGLSKGTRMLLQDSKTSNEDDYLKILVKEDIDLVNGIVIPSVEQSISNKFIEARYVRNDGMGGGVSRITIEKNPTQFDDAAVSLMEGDNGSQNITCTIPLTAALTRDMKGECDNDETKSAIISVAKAGTVMTLYGNWGSNNCDQGCVEVVAKRNLYHKVINNYETSFEDDDVKVTRSGGTQQLAGKVSSIRIAFKPDVTRPSTPKAAPNAMQVAETSATIAWSNATDNVGVKDYLVAINNATPVAETGTARVLPNLTPGTDYTVSIKARDAAGNTSPAAAFIRFATVPATPQNLSSRYSNYHFTLTWKLDNFKTQYEVYANGKKVFDGVGAMAVFYRGSVPPGPVYTFLVRAKKGETYSADTTLVWTMDETRPEEPGTPTVSRITENSADVTWERSVTPGARYFVTNGRWFATTTLTSHTFTQLRPGINQTVSVQAMGPSGNLSGPKSVKFKTGGVSTEPLPAEPKNLRVEGVVSNSVKLLWDFGEPQPFFHQVTSNYHDVGEGVMLHNNVIMKGLLSNRTYHFKVTAYDKYEQPSAPAELTVEVGDVVPPSSPRISPEPLQLSQTSVKVEWAAAEDDLGVKDYLVSLNGATPVTVVGTNQVFPSLTYGTAYEVQVSARDAAGNVSPASSLDFEIKDKQAPTSPGKPVVGDVVGHSAAMTWTAATDNVGVAGYRVSINKEPPVSVTGTAYTLTGLKDLSSYTVEVMAEDAAGNVSPAASTTFVTKDGTPPARPGNPVASNINLTSATVNWIASTDNVGVTGYKVTLEGSPPFTVTGLSHEFTGLKPLTEQTVTVQAVDAEGNLSHPATVDFKTAVRVPEPLHVTFINNGGTGTITWLRAVGATYDIWVNNQNIAEDRSSYFHTFRLSDVPPGPVYRMKIRAKMGALYSQFVERVITVDGSSRPSDPGSPVASNVTERSAVLNWTPSSSDQPLKGYRVTVNGFYYGVTPNPSYSFNNLYEGIIYWVAVRAEDVSGNLSNIALGGFRTLGASPFPPPGMPQNLQVTNPAQTSVTLDWDKESTGTAIVYVVTSDKDDIKVRAFETFATVTDLVPGLDYDFKVTGYGIHQGASEPAEISVVTLSDGPTNFRYTQPSEFMPPLLEWDAPDGKPFDKYRVVVFDPLGKVFGTKDVTLPRAQFLDMGYRTVYRVHVTAIYGDVESQPLAAEVITR